MAARPAGAQGRASSVALTAGVGGSTQTCVLPGARFTKYLTTILRLSYDNAKVTIDLRRTSTLRNIIRRAQGFFLGIDSLAKL